jgi:hypothetical protein
LASYLAARQGRDDEALAVKLNRVVASGQVPTTAFTAGDVNDIRSVINSQEFLEYTLQHIAMEIPEGADRATLRQRAETYAVRMYEAAVAELG